MGKLLFSITKKDLRIEYFRAGGKGGQHQNKTSSACRITHPASGAVGLSREERSQHQNRRIAFQRMANSKKFQRWARLQAAVVEQGFRDVEQKVDGMLTHDKLKVEEIISYVCDSCRKSETLEASYAEVSPLPVGWRAGLKEDEHFCTECNQ